jgi:hypothetical protein
VADTVPPQVTISVNPAVLWPPNRRTTKVRVEGSVKDAQTGVVGNSVEFAVRDEYQATEPHGPVVVGPSGRYSFTILLPAACNPYDKDGRHYRVRVSARDRAGNRAEQWKIVTVPHDQR